MAINLLRGTKRETFPDCPAVVTKAIKGAPFVKLFLPFYLPYLFTLFISVGQGEHWTSFEGGISGFKCQHIIYQGIFLRKVIILVSMMNTVPFW